VKKSMFALLISITTTLLGTAEPTMLVSDGQKMVFLGDSVARLGWESPGGYIRLILDAFAGEGIMVKPIPLGNNQCDSIRMRTKLHEEVLSQHPDWVVLSCGINEISNESSSMGFERFKQNVSAIVKEVTLNKSRLLILTSTPIGEGDNRYNRRLVKYNDFLRDLAKKQNLLLADLAQDFEEYLAPLKRSANSQFLTFDGVHMNPDGNILMAKGCLRALGFSDSQIAKAEQGWLTMAYTAKFDFRIDLQSELVISLAQYMELKKIAKERGMDLIGFSTALWIQALGGVLASYERGKPLDGERINRETKQRVVAKLATLVKDI